MVKVRKFLSIILIVILLLSGLGLLGYRGRSVGYDSKVKKQSTDTFVSNEKSDDFIDNLKDVFKNEDIIAYIVIPKAGVQYPVVKGENNDTYLRTNIYGKHDMSGSIFMDCANSVDFNDLRTVIYGHQMIDGSLFGGLYKSYKSDIEGEYFYIYTRDKTLVYSILISSKVPIDERNGYIGCSTESNIEFIDRLKPKVEAFNPNLVYDNISRFVSLMTCYGDGKEYRFGVTGLLTSEYNGLVKQ